MGNVSGGDLFTIETIEILETLSGPVPIPIDDKFWLEFVKIRLPDEFFHENYYEGASTLDIMVRKYFLRLMATNETSGNFSIFLRYFAAFLTAYRTAPQDSLPCSVEVVLSLATLCRVLLKQFCEAFPGPELVYHFEIASCSAGSKEEPGNHSHSCIIIYRGQRHCIPINKPEDMSPEFIHKQILAWVEDRFPDELDAFMTGNFLLRRMDGEGMITPSDVRMLFGDEDEVSSLEFHLVPLLVPHNSTISTVLIEICEFCISTAEGCVLSSDILDAQGNSKRVQRVCNDMLQVQSTLVEITILLCAVIQTSPKEPPQVSNCSDEECLRSLAPLYYSFPSTNEKTRQGIQVLVFLEALLEAFKHGPADESRGSLCMNFTVFLTNAIGLQLGGSRPTVSASGARLAYRSLTLLTSLIYYQPSCGDTNCFGECIGKVSDPALQGEGSAATLQKGLLRLSPVSFESLLQAILKQLSEHMFVFFFYVLVYRNPSFRLYCLSRTDHEEIFEPIFILLYRLPDVCHKLQREQIPSPATILCIILLILSKDRSIIASTSRMSLTDVVWFHNRALTNISLSSVWILVLLRLLQWNFSKYKDSFFVSILAGIFSNMATNGIEDLHWHTAQRLVDVSNMLAKTTIQISREDGAEPSTRAMPYRLLLATLLQLQWSMLGDCKSASRNPTLAFTFMRAIPNHLASIPEHLPVTSLPARCVMALQEVIKWFHESFQEVFDTEDDQGYEVQLEVLKKAAARMPDLNRLKDRQPRPVCYDETTQSMSFFMPVIWKAVYHVMPSEVCWRKYDLKTAAAA